MLVFGKLGILTEYGYYSLSSLAYFKFNLGSLTAREDVHSFNTRGRFVGMYTESVGLKINKLVLCNFVYFKLRNLEFYAT